MRKELRKKFKKKKVGGKVLWIRKIYWAKHNQRMRRRKRIRQKELASYGRSVRKVARQKKLFG